MIGTGDSTGRRAGLSAILLCLAALAAAALAGCGGASEPEESPEAGEGSGTLEVRADGEERARDGFVSKDGWALDFEHVYVTFSGVTAYQSDPPYTPEDGENVQAAEEVSFEEERTVDLAQGDDAETSVPVAEDDEAPAGHYNALYWRMAPASGGPAGDASLLLAGTAEKDGEAVEFELSVDREYEYYCGEYVGEERKGILEDSGEAELEATFHFDHLFGDETSDDPGLNEAALGFEPLAEAAEDGRIAASMDELRELLPEEDYEKLEGELPTLGHVGEGHCYEANSGATG